MQLLGSVQSASCTASTTPRLVRAYHEGLVHAPPVQQQVLAVHCSTSSISANTIKEMTYGHTTTHTAAAATAQCSCL